MTYIGKTLVAIALGQLKLDIYPLMQLGERQPQLLDQVKGGVVAPVWTLLGATPGGFLQTEVFELPLAQKSAVATNLAFCDTLTEQLANNFKSSGCWNSRMQTQRVTELA